MNDLNRIRQLSGLPLLESSTAPFNNQFETGGWDNGPSALKTLDSAYQHQIKNVTDSLEKDDFGFPSWKEYAQKEAITLPKKYKKNREAITNWQSKHGAHAPVAKPPQLLSAIQAISKTTADGVNRSLAELESALGEIDWYEMQAAPHSKEDLGLGWTIRVEGKVRSTNEPIQFTSCSFYARGAGQRFFRFKSNTKQPFNRLNAVAGQNRPNI